MSFEADAELVPWRGEGKRAAKRAQLLDRVPWLRAEGIHAPLTRSQEVPRWQLQQYRELHALQRSSRSGNVFPGFDMQDGRHLRLVLFVLKESPLGDFGRWFQDRADSLAQLLALQAGRGARDPDWLYQQLESEAGRRSRQNKAQMLAPIPGLNRPERTDAIYVLASSPSGQDYQLDSPHEAANQVGGETFRQLLGRAFGAECRLSDEMLAALNPSLALEGMKTWHDAYQADPKSTLMLAFQVRRLALSTWATLTPQMVQTLARLLSPTGPVGRANQYGFYSSLWAGFFGSYPQIRTLV